MRCHRIEPPEGLAEYAEEQDDGAAIAGADDANAAAPPEQHPERMLALALSASDIISLKVDQLKMHLKWRGQSLDGLKAELRSRLDWAVANKIPVLSTLPGGSVCSAAVAARAAEWEPLDPSMIDRPVWTGAEGKFEPNINASSRTHPFAYMCEFYEPEACKEQESNSIRYACHLKAELLDKMPYKQASDMTMARNSLAHATLLLQGLNPVPSQRHLHRRSFGIKGHRARDLLTRDEWIWWKAHFHISLYLRAGISSFSFSEAITPSLSSKRNFLPFIIGACTLFQTC